MRAALAERRAFAPFLGAVESGGVERRWDELTKAEQRQFAEHALKCEMLLLHRADDDARAQSDPGTFLTVGERRELEEIRRLFGRGPEQPSDLVDEG